VTSEQTVERSTHLGTDAASAVRRLVSSAPDAADSPQLSDQGLLNLDAVTGAEHLLLSRAGTVLGYAQLTRQQGDEPTDGEHLLVEVVTAAADLAADLAAEIAAELLQAALDGAGGTNQTHIRVWAHGMNSPIHRAAQLAGFAATRTLLQLRRPLDGEPSLTDGELRLPNGVTLRPFVPGQDDAAWLRVNAAAFADHPEQGGWTQADLTGRIESDWFDPAGFLLAVRDSQLLGFHWTKVHPAVGRGAALGEVYVIGVAPSAQGMKLGKTLLIAGLRHLIAEGLTAVLLYVDESNTTAVQLYRGMGFSTFSADVQYSHG
jgi:mycothiol synthase